jgi:hypothetical protein
MTETKSERRPRRDPSGRLSTIGDLLGTALAGLVIGVVLLLAFEAIVALVRAGDFGDTSGWLALALPLWLCVEEFRAARESGPNRVVVAVLAAGFGLAIGLSCASVAAATFPVLVSGLAGAAGFTLVYCLVWFYGLRWLGHRAG